MPVDVPTPLPSGVVTFLFTDIEGSTRLLASLGEAYGDLLDQHDAVIREALGLHDGRELATEGDAFFAVFAVARDAIAAARALQQGLAACAWPVDGELRVRVGIHTGFARPRGDRYVSIAINQAARIVECAHGGQVLLSPDVVAELSDAERPLVAALGRHRVRDFDDPVDLHHVVAEGWLDPGRPPRARPAQGHNLTAPRTELIGRSADVASILPDLIPGAIVSLLGPGGVGKTRLSVEVGLRVADQWADGVWLADLGEAQSADWVADAIVMAIGASRSPGVATLEEAAAHLEDRQLLLLLDNCEHVLEDVARVVDELHLRAPSVCFLATSRRQLGLRNEQVHRIHPLGTQDAPDGDPSQAGLLFARALGRPLRPDEEEAAAALCRELDGLPLALELAAAQARSMSVPGLLERLRSSPGVLQSADPSLPDRQRSLGNLLEASLTLVDEVERAVLRRAAMFAGAFDVRRCHQACAGLALEEVEVSAALWRLHEESLVTGDVSGGAAPYRLSPIVRAHIREDLSTGVRREVARALALAYHQELGPAVADGQSWVSQMQQEMINVQGVIDELADLGDDAEVEVAQQLAWSIARLHEVRNAYRTGLDELAEALAALPASTPTRVAMLTLRADLHLHMGQVDQARQVLDDAEALADKVGLPGWDDVCVLRSRGEVALRIGELDLAGHLARRALAIAGTPRSRARAWNLAGIADANRGRMDDAAASFEEEVREAGRADLDAFLVKSHGNLAEVRLVQGRRSEAARHQLESLDRARANGERVYVAYALLVAARLVSQDDMQQALLLHEAAAGALAESGHVLYAEDEKRLLALRTRARAELGQHVADAAEVVGRGMSPRESADMAEAVLRRCAETKEVPNV